MSEVVRALTPKSSPSRFQKLLEGIKNGRLAVAAAALAVLAGCGARSEMNAPFKGDAGVEIPDAGPDAEPDADVPAPVLECKGGDISGMTLPGEATGVEVLEVICTAKYGDTGIHAFNDFHKFGVGSVDDFSGIFVFNGSQRITPKSVVDPVTQTVSFPPVNHVIPDGETQTFSLVVNVDNDMVSGGGEHGFEILNKGSISSDPSVSGTFPIKGNMFSTTGISIDGLTRIHKNGDLQEVYPGEKARLAQFEIECWPGNCDFEKIALRFEGTCDAKNISDMTLRTEGGENLAYASEVGPLDLATFVLDPSYILLEGQPKVFYVEGVNNCKSGQNIVVYIDETVDVRTIDSAYGFGKFPDFGLYDGTYDGSSEDKASVVKVL